MVEVEVNNADLAALDRKLKALAYPEARGIVSKSLRAGAKLEQAAAIAAAPTLTGKLKSNIKVRAGKRTKGYVTIHVIIGKKWWTGDAFYGAFVEWGHRLGSRKLGTKRRKIAGEHFLEYTAEETAPAAINLIAETTKTLIEQLAASKV